MASYTVATRGIDISRGRGAAKVTISVSFKELEAWAKKNALDTSRLMQRSFFWACKGLKDKLKQVMRSGGGVYGVPKFKDFEAFTKELRAASGKKTRMGGVLAEKESFYGGRSGAWYYVGWKDYLAQAAKKFQDGLGGEISERYFTDANYRAMWHRKGLKNVPRSYVHNPRRVLPEPFGSYVRAHLKEWAKGAFYKALAKQMQKGSKA